MKYFHLFICLFLTGISLYLFLRFYFKMRKDYFLKKIQTAVFNEQASLNHRVFFSSWVIISALKKAFHFSKQERDFLLSYLLKGEIENAASLFDKTDAVWIASGLRAFLDPKKQINLLENLIKANPENQNLLLLLTEIYFTLGEYQKFKLALSSISQNTPYSTAKKFYWEAYNYLQEGDLLSASENLSKAVKIFHKNAYFYEEAEAHLLMGTIYRICAVEDVSLFMFKTAQKIFNELNAKRKEAEVLGNLGMLMVLQSRFDEAFDFFKKAKDIYLFFKQSLGEAEIINQEALTLLIQKNFSSAQKSAQKAFNMHKKINNIEGEAFSLELLGHMNCETKNWNAVLNHSRKAQSFYIKTQNFPALLESLFLEAKADFELEKNNESENILRKIIDFSLNHPSCFHVANAYNLLGLIYLKLGNLKRAKGLFQQSLEQELKNERASGAAIDYTNIAMIDYRRGLNEQAEITLKRALDYAKADGETELVAFLEDLINKNSIH